MTSQQVAYGLWQSTLDIGTLFKTSVEPMYPFRENGVLYWMQADPTQAGQVALMSQQGNHRKKITPAPFDIRTTVHEYGGRCFAVHNGVMIFNHRKDGRLYRMALDGSDEPQVLSEGILEGQVTQFSDLTISHDGRWLLAVAELKQQESENENLLVSLCLQAQNKPQIRVLVRGADFYAAPTISANNSHIAWIEWHHPNMPWDQSRLCVAAVKLAAEKLQIDAVSMLVNQTNQSVCQVGFIDQNSLIYTTDSDSGHDGPQGFWNLYRANIFNASSDAITQDLAEYGEPHWVFGQSRWTLAGSDYLYAIRTDHEGDCVVQIDLNSRQQIIVAQDYACCQHIFSSPDNPDEVLWVAHKYNQSAQIVSLTRSTGEGSIYPKMQHTIKRRQVSEVESICYPTRDGEHAYAYFFPPYNQEFSAPAWTKPPLLVMVHGGPTARTDRRFLLLKQYFTNLGFAIVDVNHRGSSGYGRQYRQQLLGHWGETDVDDIADVIQYLADKDKIDPRLIFIRGSSAGGYAVLRALTRYPNLFTGGACYYGIGNLITLAATTHKFESCYTDNLIGEVFDPQKATTQTSQYYLRSPIFAIDQLTTPVILFQGLDDKVVAPTVAREVVAKLVQNSIQHEYHEYLHEGHGFKNATTRIDALSRETKFYQSLIKSILPSI